MGEREYLDCLRFSNGSVQLMRREAILELCYRLSLLPTESFDQACVISVSLPC